MCQPPKKKSKRSDKPERELARGSAEARSAGEVTPGPQDSHGVTPTSRRDATRGEAKSGGGGTQAGIRAWDFIGRSIFSKGVELRVRRGVYLLRQQRKQPSP